MHRPTDKRSARAFDNPILERLSRAHPAMPLCVWGPLAVLFVAVGPALGLGGFATLGGVVGGMFAWTLAEYALHRWVFHWRPRSERLRRLFYPVHQLHHDVQEWDRLVAPILMAAPVFLLLLLFTGLIWRLLGQPIVFPFSGGFVVGYLIYDYVHFYTHFARPRARIGRGLRRRHLQHHFACHDHWYGVSSPLWDYVFRTHVPRGVRPARLAGR